MSLYTQAAALVVAFCLCIFCLSGCSSTESSQTTSSPPSAPSTTTSPSSCVHVSPSVLQYSYDTVRLTWDLNASSGDTVELYPKDTPSRVMFRVLLDDLNGAKEYEFNPVNPRGGGYIVKYVNSNRTEMCSTTLTFAQGDNEPTQPHLTVVGNDELQVNWVSASSEPGEVIYQVGGTDAWVTHKESRTPRTYKATDMCGVPATGTGFRNPGYFHSVSIPNLDQESAIRIRTGNATSKTFTSAPRILAGDAKRHKVLMVGDLGTSGAGQLGGARGFGVLEFPPESPGYVMTRYNESEFALGVIYGDISYANGFSTVWDQYGDELANNGGMLHPTVTSVGNHEYISLNNPTGWYPDFGDYRRPDSGGECGIPFSHRYPRDGDESAHNYWFSFDFGLVHYIMLSTEHDYLNGSSQHQWLENDLSRVDRNKTPWIVATGHRPVYDPCSSNGVAGDIGEMLRSDVFSLLEKNNVDLYFTGHLHRYARSSPVNGIVHVLAGSGRFTAYTCQNDLPHPMEKSLLNVGYVELDIISRRELNATFWAYDSSSDEMKILDSFALAK